MEHDKIGLWTCLIWGSECARHGQSMEMVEGVVRRFVIMNCICDCSIRVDETSKWIPFRVMERRVLVLHKKLPSQASISMSQNFGTLDNIFSKLMEIWARLLFLRRTQIWKLFEGSGSVFDVSHGVYRNVVWKIDSPCILVNNFNNFDWTHSPNSELLWGMHRKGRVWEKLPAQINLVTNIVWQWRIFLLLRAACRVWASLWAKVALWNDSSNECLNSVTLGRLSSF